MFKKCYAVFLFIFIIFILIPVSFANENITDFDINGVNDMDIIKDDTLNDEIHVDVHNGNDENSGDSANPVSTIGRALNISSSNSKIIVHEGIYKENNLNISKSLEIYGQGDVVIDAENKSRIFTVNTGSSDSVFISGITFINGNAYNGGAMYILNAVTTIDNSRFINNTALTEGGAIYWNSINGLISNSLIESNYGRGGSGIQWGESSTDFSVGSADYGQIINCTFKNNHLMQDDDACIGLSIYSHRTKVINSTFIDHYTPYNSTFEVLYINGDYGTVEGCLFANNSMAYTSALGLDGNYAVVNRNTFINNTVSFKDSFGGAIGIQSETGSICNNTFIANGGDECLGGAIYINIQEDHQFSFIDITDNIFKNNQALLGGSIYTNAQGCMLTLTVKRNVFEGDNAKNASSIYLSNIYDPTTISNNTFKNLKSDYGAVIYSRASYISISDNLIYNSSSLFSENICTDSKVIGSLKLKFNDVIGAVNQSTVLTANLTDDMGNGISVRGIEFTVDGKDIRRTNSYNSAIATFDEFGTYVINGSYENAKVETGILTVLHSASIKIEPVINYGKRVNFVITLTNSSGAIANAGIMFYSNNQSIILKTDDEGKARFTTNLDFGNYSVIASFTDDEYYKSVNETVTINVFFSVESQDLVRGYNSGSDFKIKLYNDTGVLVQTNVDFMVNGIKYTVKTDDDGIANLNVKLAAGSYSIYVLNPFTGDEIFNTLQIVGRISDNKNMNVYFGSGNSYKIRVYGDDGNPVGVGEYVTLKIASKTYTVKTDMNGFASFKLNKLNPKTYTLTATYKGFKVSNKIVVKPVLTAKNISKKKAKKIKFKAKLLNSNGKALKGKKITFKIKGKTYKVKTNKKGIATLTLKKLKVGKYKITTKYGKSTIKNTIKIKK